MSTGEDPDRWPGAPFDDAHDSPEAAAMATWRDTPTAMATVVEVRRRGDDEALVTIRLDVTREHPYRETSTCLRRPDGRWYCAGTTGR